MENNLAKRKMQARIVQSVREFGWTEVRLTQLLAPSSKSDPEFPVGTCITQHINAAQSSTDTCCSYTNSTSDFSGGAGRSSSSGEYTRKYDKVDPCRELGSGSLTTDTSLSGAGTRLQPHSCCWYTHTEVCAGWPGHSWTPSS